LLNVDADCPTFAIMANSNSWMPFPSLKVTEPSDAGGSTVEKGKAAGAGAPTWPEDNPFEDHYMSTALKKDRPFSEQPTLAGRPYSEQPGLAPIASIPPEYGNEHEAAREGAIARSEHIEDVTEETNVEKVRDTRGRRLKRHCMRYWICYLLLNIILLAIMLPIL
jgi:hypothetical protein